MRLSMLSRSEIAGKLTGFKTDLKKHYHVERMRFFETNEDSLTFVVAFDSMLTSSASLTRKELESWLSNMLQCKAHVLIEHYVKYFLKHKEEDLILN